MALDADLLAEIEEWAGPALADEDYEATYNRTGSATSTALSVLRRRRAALLSKNPVSFRIEGDYAQDGRLNLESIERAIAQLEELPSGGGSSVTTADLVRPSGRTRFA